MSDSTCTPDECRNRKPRGGVCAKCYERARWQRVKSDPELHAKERERINNMRLEQRRADPEKARRESREGARRHRANNPEAHRANKARNGTRWIQEWRAANPEAARMKWREERRMRAANMRGPRVDYAAILDEHGMVCHLCGGDIPSLAALHMDHVVPLARGGAHHADNIRPSHALCNLRKGARVA